MSQKHSCDIGSRLTHVQNASLGFQKIDDKERGGVIVMRVPDVADPND